MYNHVIWPEQYDPKISPIYALNDIDVNAPPEVVWKLLVDAENWWSYFPAENQVKILTGEPELALGTKFSRVTIGFLMFPIVTEYVLGSRLAWSTTVDGDKTGSTAYHGWVITPTDYGCHVLSEETQQGPFFLEELGHKSPGGLYCYHQEWVEALKRAAEAEAAKSKASQTGRDAHRKGRVMAETNVEKVLAVFEAIKAQDANRAAQYVDDHFVQHYPHIAAGVEGFKQYINNSTPEQLKLTVVRSFQDGDYVVTQIKAESSGDNMFAIYRFQDGLIVEHWAFSAVNAPPNKSGHTQFDGPTEAKCVEDTERNKAFARTYYETFHISGDHSQNSNFFTGDLMIRHEPGVRDGVEEFLRDVEVLMQHRTIHEVKLLLGCGDLVFIAAKGTHEGDPCVYVDLYRVEDEKIVEHWGFPEAIPPQEEWKNNNGML